MYQFSAVRIYSQNGIIGAGCLVSGGQVLTCAHVAAQADPGAEGPLAVDFPLVEPGQTCRVEVLHIDPERDACVLRLLDPPPVAARAAPLASASEFWGHLFRTYGFPAGYDLGVWSDGEIRGMNAAGWFQLVDPKPGGYLIAPGFSGAAVWDDRLGGVVGLVVTAERDRELRAAFMLPLLVFQRAFPDLESIFPTRAKPEAPLEAFHLRIWAQMTVSAQKTRDITVLPRKAHQEFRLGDRVFLGFQASRNCYLTLLNRGSSGRLAVLLPNPYFPTPFLRAEETCWFPSPEQDFDFVLEGPAGVEELWAIATERPVWNDQQGIEDNLLAVRRADYAEAHCFLHVG